jgi:hypothetical protein
MLKMSHHFFPSLLPLLTDVGIFYFPHFDGGSALGFAGEHPFGVGGAMDFPMQDDCFGGSLGPQPVVGVGGFGPQPVVGVGGFGPQPVVGVGAF